MRAGIATTLAVLAVAGCSGDSGGSDGIPPNALSRLVLQRDDLPSSFDQFDEGAQGTAETTSELRSDPARFGREGGWKARYRRAGSADTPGPLVIESRADLFADEDGAGEDLAAYREEVEQAVQPTGGRLLAGLELGAEATGVTFREDRVRFFRIAWRQENATALLFVNGFDGRLELAEVLELARKQQRRIEGASAER